MTAAGHSRKSAAKPFRLTALEPTEFDLQRAVSELLDWLILPPAFYTAFPAGWGKLPPRIAGLLKACGLKRGMPDILVFDVGRVIGIELKARRNIVSDEQREMHSKLLACGFEIYVCRTVEQVIQALKDEKVPMRQRWVDCYETTSNTVTEKGGTPQSP